MKNYLSSIRLIAIGVGLCSAVALRAAAPVTVAVFDPEVTVPALKERAVHVGALLLAELSDNPDLALVERSQLDAALGEVSLGASGLIEAGSAATVGKLTGAKVLVLVRVIGTANEWTLVAKVLGTETSRVFATARTSKSGEEVSVVVNDAAEAIARLIGEHRNDLLAPVETETAVQERLRALLAGRRLPVLSVSIPEQHLSRPIRDPAAETEIVRLLRALGAEVFEPGASGRAGIQISGEAFSEFGGRRGDFVSCRARVEIKVTEVSTGRIILQDRQTEIGVDLTEAIAAKNALQVAGAHLAERVVVALAQPGA